MSLLALRSAAALALATVASSAAWSQVTITMSSWVPPTHTLTETQKEWCALIEQKVPGKVKCQQLPRAVSAAPGTFDAVRNGLVDLSFTVHGYTPGRFVTTQFVEVPFLGDSSEVTSVAFQRVYAEEPRHRRRTQGREGAGRVHARPGHRLQHQEAGGEDGRPDRHEVARGRRHGQRDRQGLGMNVTLKPAPESYELLSTGVMDGTLFPAESVEGFKIDKVIKYATLFPGGLYNTSFVFMMNQAKYDSLPPDVKKVVDEISGEFAARMIGRGWDKVDRRGMAFMQANGVQFTKADATFVKAVQDKTAPLEDKWAAEAEKKGLKNAKKVLADFRAEIKKLQ
jgi:TRAP-type C4-dicarboxylate transport system substrate-binding protein